MIDKRKVYMVITEEREYQDRLGSERTEGKIHTVGDFLVMLQYYTTKAISEWTENAGDLSALHEIRKCAAICVHCMEEWGAPRR